MAIPPFQTAGEAVTSRIRIEADSLPSAEIVCPLTIKRGWHVYSTDIPSGGPNPTEIVLDSISGATLDGPLYFVGQEKNAYDNLFDMEIRFFEGSVEFRQKLNITSDDYYVSGYLVYSACNDHECLPPTRVEFTFSPEKPEPADATAQISDYSSIDGYDPVTWAPVEYREKTETSSNGGLFGLLLTSMLGGLLALLTPCVWPVIPMTVSFFLKRAESRKNGIGGAMIYGASIIGIYVTLGIVITLLFGASALNSLATNALVNIVFFLMLVFFALSFFGLFEIRLPSGWSTDMNRKSRQAGGFLGIFFMALTLSIVSFSCTGPIIGFLLVDAASSGSILAPTVGMLGFSLAMAVPFTLFAMFPSWLKQMPKSGGWMDKVKVTLGFVELAFSLKFLSVADMAYGWGILPRDLFVLLWCVMAVLLGLSLLGVIRLHKDQEKEKPGKGSIVAAVISFLFAIWLIPGLWGAPLKAISAFAPPMNTQRLNLVGVQVEPVSTDYREALELSARTGKPVLIDFTGYGCVNCRKMEAAVWTDSKVSEKIEKDFILLSLFVDDKTALDAPVTVLENGQTMKLRTVGDKWSLLQRYKFGANAQPFYVIVDAKGNLLSGPYTFDTDVQHFLDFLNF
ncbi:MAG: thioredoxin family protein [Bacteroidaceae bacterium]|nr:thioredoxin family protein [Bacteroidaceae bacterium]